ncbi:MAG: SLC13 family permease [Polyangia bacterium]|nr:SLC13 family permease [Polyangia bacterium]
MTWLQTLCLFSTGYLVSRLLLVVELHHELVAWLLARSRRRVSVVVLGVMLLSFAMSTVVPNALTVLALLPVLARLRSMTGLAATEASSAVGSSARPSPAAAASSAALSPGSVGSAAGAPAIPAAFGTLLAMALIYGANLGGVGSLLGSPANLYLLVSLRIYEVPGRESLHFVSWLAFGIPMALGLLLLLWGVFWVTAPSAMARALPAQEDSPGPQDPSRREGSPRRRAALWFLGLWGLGWALLLGANLALGFGRPAGSPATPIIFSGSILGEALVFETMDAFAAALSTGFTLALFAWPVKGPKGRSRLLGLRDLTRELPWRGLLVAAAVLALLVIVARAGAASWLRDQMPGLIPGSRSPLVLVLVMVTITIFATEVLNNTTVSTVLFPVGAAAAPALGADPLMIMLGISLASTCAFMTPVATPVNALALASLRGVSYRRFILTGLVTNIVSALWISLWLVFVVPHVLGLFGWP